MTITALLDRSAILLSMSCVVHCLALPVAIVMLPTLSAYWFADEYFHLLLLYLVLPTSVIALGLGCRRHRVFKMMVWGSAGLMCLIAAILLGHDWLGEFGEKGLTLLGGGLVVAAHIHNFRNCRQCQCAH